MRTRSKIPSNESLTHPNPSYLRAIFKFHKMTNQFIPLRFYRPTTLLALTICTSILILLLTLPIPSLTQQQIPLQQSGQSQFIPEGTELTLPSKPIQARSGPPRIVSQARMMDFISIPLIHCVGYHHTRLRPFRRLVGRFYPR